MSRVHLRPHFFDRSRLDPDEPHCWDVDEYAANGHWMGSSINLTHEEARAEAKKIRGRHRREQLAATKKGQL